MAGLLKPQVPQQDSSNFGILKNTITGLPQAAKDVGGAIKNFFTPGRGFTDQQIAQAKPTLKEKSVGLLRSVAEVGSGIATAGKAILTRLPVPQPTLGEDPLAKFAQPKTAGEAATMRFADVASLGIGGGMKNVGKVSKVISATKDVAVIEKELKGLGMADNVIKEVAPKLVEVSDPVAVSKMIDDASKPATAGLLKSPVAPQLPKKPVETLKTVVQTPPPPKVSTTPSPAVGTLAPGVPVGSKTLPKLYPPKVEEAIKQASVATKEPVNIVKQKLDRLKQLKTALIEGVQDKEVRVRKLTELPKVKLNDASNPYQKMKLFPGRTGQLKEAGNQAGQAIVNDAKKLADSLKSDLPSVRKQVNEYMIAKHAPERNASLGDRAAGISTSEAKKAVDEAKKAPHYAQIEAISGKIKELNDKTLDMLHQSGVISDELYSTLRKKYKNHVPLNRIMEDTQDFAGAMSGKGFDVRSTGIKRAVGSQREVSDILGNVLHNYEQAVLRSEKNIVDQATLAFVRKNQKELGDLFEIKKPRAIGKDFSGEKFIMEQTNDPQILQMFENGKRIWIKVKDPQLAIALRGIGKEKLGPFLNAIGAFTRVYSGLATRFNPEFALPNKLRDLQESMIYLASQKDIGFKGAAKMSVKDPGSMKDVIDSLRGKDTAGAKLYQEMKELGGTTGGFGLSTKKMVEMDIAKMEKLATSPTRRVANNLVEYIDNWNTIFEDSTRLSVYKQALEQGATKDRAAFLAKQASIDFNTMGKGGPVINALYMFSNASIQGSAKMLRAMKNPKVAATVATIVGSSVAATNEWNDKADKDWRDKVTKWDRLNGLPVVIPSTDETFRYFVIPVSWGLKPIKVMADYASDMTSGIKYSTKEVANTVFSAIVDSYNPVGGNDWLQAITPTIIDTPADIQRNISWTGGKIRADYDKNAPRDIQYFPSLAETGTGRVAISITEFLQKKDLALVSPADLKYAFDSYIGGTGKSITKLINTGTAAVTGEDLPFDEYPMLSRFYREANPDQIFSKGSSDISLRLQNQSRDTFKRKQTAEQLDVELSKLPKEEANAKLKEIKKEDPLLYDKVKDAFESRKLGLTYKEKQMKQLGVANGERAKYIDEQIMLLETKEERNAYLQELKDKKLVTPEVLTQIKKLHDPR